MLCGGGRAQWGALHGEIRLGATCGRVPKGAVRLGSWSFLALNPPLFLRTSPESIGKQGREVIDLEVEGKNRG